MTPTREQVEKVWLKDPHDVFEVNLNGGLDIYRTCNSCGEAVPSIHFCTVCGVAVDSQGIGMVMD